MSKIHCLKHSPHLSDSALKSCLFVLDCGSLYHQYFTVRKHNKVFCKPYISDVSPSCTGKNITELYPLLQQALNVVAVTLQLIAHHRLPQNQTQVESILFPTKYQVSKYVDRKLSLKPFCIVIPFSIISSFVLNMRSCQDTSIQHVPIFQKR